MPATKLVTFADSKGGPRPGAMLDDGRVLDLAAAASGTFAAQAADMLALIEAGPAVLTAVRALAADPPAAAVLDAGAVRLLAPIPRPRRNVFCVGRNYMDHVAEGDRTRGIEKSELPKYPQFFTKAPESVIGPEEDIPDHAGITQWLDYEVELAVVIGRKAATSPPSARWTTSSAGRSPTTSPAASSSAATASGSRASRSTAPARSAPGSCRPRSSTRSTPASAAASTARRARTAAPAR